LTVNLPNSTAYHISDVLTITTDQVLTSLTVNAGTAPAQTVRGAAITTAALGQSFQYKYVAVNTWQRIL
jgi:hypothetical protein